MILNFLILWLTSANPVLDRAAAAAQALWEQLPALQCTEKILQNRVVDSGKVQEHSEAIYDYILFLKTRGTSLLVDESRVPQGPSKPAADAMLKTSGFPTLLFLFHPAFRDRFEFDEPVRTGDQSVMKVAFRPRMELAAMAALKVQDRFYPVHWKGSAWLDEQTGAVIQISAGLADPTELEALGIQELHADVSYGPVKLSGTQRAVTVPNRAVITLATARQRWENVHEFSQYRAFSVTTTTRPPR